MIRVAARPAAEALTVVVATSVAVLAIMMPISFADLGESAHDDLLVFNIPRAMTGGAFIAVITAAVTVAVGSVRTARWTALLALAGILLSHLLAAGDSSDGRLDSGVSLATLNFVDALLAGMALGATAVAVWNEPRLRIAYLFAAIGATVLGDLTQTPTDDTTGGFDGALAGSLPLWFIGGSVLALAYFAVTSATPAPAHTDSAIPLAPVLAAVFVYSAIIFTSLNVSHHKTSLRHVVIASIIVLAATAAAAFVLPERDGVLTVLMSSFSVAGSLVITLPRNGWVDLGTLVAIAIGLGLGMHRPRPLAAALWIVALAGLTLAADITAPPATLTAAVGCLALGAICGYGVGSAVPVNSSSAVVGFCVLFVPSLGVALSDTEFGHLAYSSAWYRTAEVDRGPVPGTVAVIIALVCTAIVALILRRRQPSLPDSGPQSL
ncbi:hypothetical protein [Nocardia rosealba]|uniref:hypothetical protein n=1 Tax=Nocardia rosealba TaxID=2878563 RepID=UPI001CD93B85|nr:hypothetical protein [Nocardia rosealba]MCA2206684.1 hypothetical protein [Nocardia rosealba]